MQNSKEQKILQKVISEAWNNPSYKEELVANPSAAVQKLTGKSFTLPEGKTLAVCDQSNPNKVYLNIPVVPNLDNVELTDKELEDVAGGNMPTRFLPIFPPPTNGPFDPTAE